METKMIPLIMTLVVGIILAGSLLMPVITDAQHATSDITTTLNSKSSPYISETTDLAYIAASDSETMNGESITIPAYTQVITTDAGVLYKIGPAIFTLFIPSENVKALINLNSTDTSMTATIADGTFTVSYGSTEYSVSITNAYAYTGSGDYTESNSWPTFKTNAGTSGLITFGDGYYSTINGIVIVDDWTSGNGTAHYYSATWDETTAPVTWSVVDNGDGSYTISNIVIDSIDVLSTTHRTLYQNEYWTYSPTPTSTLIGVIPIMVIVALVVAAIGMVAVRRND